MDGVNRQMNTRQLDTAIDEHGDFGDSVQFSLCSFV